MGAPRTRARTSAGSATCGASPAAADRRLAPAMGPTSGRRRAALSMAMAIAPAGLQLIGCPPVGGGVVHSRHFLVAMVVARSYREAALGGARVRALLLARSPDLACRTLMCERVGEACACRLALVLARAPQLQRLDLSSNRLPALPDAAFALCRLTHLDASRNALRELPPLVAGLRALQVLDLSHNQLQALPERELEALPDLRELRVAHNPALDVRSEALRAKIVLS